MPLFVHKFHLLFYFASFLISTMLLFQFSTYLLFNCSTVLIFHFSCPGPANNRREEQEARVYKTCYPDLLRTGSSWGILQGTLYPAQCAVNSVQCAVCSVQCAVCSFQCAVFSVQFSVCNQCAVCSVQCVA